MVTANQQIVDNGLFDNVRIDLLKIYEDSENEPDYRKVTDFLKFSRREMANMANVKLNSVRYDPERMPQELTNVLNEMIMVINYVGDIFEGNIQKTQAWFHTKNPMLGYVTPRDMILFGRHKKLMKFILEARKNKPAS